jgi:hypothetical protein
LRVSLVFVTVALVAVGALALVQLNYSNGIVRDMSRRTADLERQLDSLRHSLALLSNQTLSSSTPPAGVLSFGDPYATGGEPWHAVVPGFNGASATANVTGIEVDGLPFFGAVGPGEFPIPLSPGSPFALTFDISSGGGLTYEVGQTVLLKVFMSTGQSFSLKVVLPAQGSPYANALALDGGVVGNSVFLRVRNRTMFSVFITNVVFNGTEVPHGVCEFSNEIVGTSVFAWTSGGISFPVVGGKSGVAYTVTLMTQEAGNYSIVVTWP